MLGAAPFDKAILVGYPVIERLLEYSCLLINALVRGNDGITAWMRTSGRPFSQQMARFGESVLYRYPTKGLQHHPHGSVDALGGEGVFLGRNMFSNTVVAGLADGSWIETRSIISRPEEER